MWMHSSAVGCNTNVMRWATTWKLKLSAVRWMYWDIYTIIPLHRFYEVERCHAWGIVCVRPSAAKRHREQTAGSRSAKFSHTYARRQSRCQFSVKSSASLNTSFQGQHSNLVHLKVHTWISRKAWQIWANISIVNSICARSKKQSVVILRLLYSCYSMDAHQGLWLLCRTVLG